MGDFSDLPGMIFAGGLITDRPAKPQSKQYMFYAWDDEVIYASDKNLDWVAIGKLVGFSGFCQGRLTLSSGVPVVTSDVTGSTLYFAPFNGNIVSLYNGAKWIAQSFSQINKAIPSSTNTNYDVFLYDNSGSLDLEFVAWTDDTNRATAITRLDGVYLKSGAMDRRYLGTIRTTDVSGQCEDSQAKRLVWNYYNPLLRQMLVQELTNSWSYTTAAWRMMNNSSANRIQFVIGVGESPVNAKATGNVGTTNASAFNVGIALDNTSTPSHTLTAQSFAGSIGNPVGSHVYYDGYPGIGFHYLQALEWGGATQTHYGDNGNDRVVSGIAGTIRG